MKRLFIFIAFILHCVFLNTVHGEFVINSSDANQRFSYSLGNIIGNEIKRNQMALNISVLRKGLEDSQTEIAPLVDALETRRLASHVSNQIHTQMGLESDYSIQARHQLHRNRESSGGSFLSANKHRNGVVSLPSGVQYKVIKQGKGNSPLATDTVEIEIHAHSVDGKQIAYSAKGETTNVQVNSLIKGLSETVQLMQPGAIWEVYIPPQLAYTRIRRYAHLTVIAEVRLVAIN